MAQSYTCLTYHIVFGTRSRTCQIKNNIQDRLFQYIDGIINGLDGSGLAVGGMPDHVHLLASLPANRSLSDSVREIKATSSKWIHDTYPNLHDFGWQPGYGAFTVSMSNVDQVRTYVLNQQSHHAGQSFDDELKELLSRHGLRHPLDP